MISLGSRMITLLRIGNEHTVFLCSKNNLRFRKFFFFLHALSSWKFQLKHGSIKTPNSLIRVTPF